MMEKPFEINYSSRQREMLRGKKDVHPGPKAGNEDSLIIESNTIYEVDLSCIQRKQKKKR